MVGLENMTATRKREREKDDRGGKQMWETKAPESYRNRRKLSRKRFLYSTTKKKKIRKNKKWKERDSTEKKMT